MAKECEHCGSSPVPHGLKRFSAHVEELYSPLLSLTRLVSRRKNARADSLESRVLASVFSLLALMRVGSFHAEPDERDFKYVTHVLFTAAKERGVRLRQFRPFGAVLHTFVAEKEGGTLVFERLPVPHGAGRGAHWIDNKARLRRELQARGFPTAPGGDVVRERDALALFRSLRKPVIVKPHNGSGTRHTTLHITDEETFIRAFRIARQVSPRVIVEEELSGEVYRPTVVGGRLVAVIERLQPSVVGDGRHSIEELIAQENAHEKRRGPVFSPIPVSDALVRELARQGYTLASIPEQGVRVLLHQKINWSVGGTTRDVTDTVHPENRALFEHIARELDAPIVGIDFIIPDISRSWREQEHCGVIECNSMPFIDTHHFPFEGMPRDVAGALWDTAFPRA